jgi:hypothetical protein
LDQWVIAPLNCFYCELPNSRPGENHLGYHGTTKQRPELQADNGQNW